MKSNIQTALLFISDICKCLVIFKHALWCVVILKSLIMYSAISAVVMKKQFASEKPLRTLLYMVLLQSNTGNSGPSPITATYLSKAIVIAFRCNMTATH